MSNRPATYLIHFYTVSVEYKCHTTRCCLWAVICVKLCLNSATSFLVNFSYISSSQLWRSTRFGSSGTTSPSETDEKTDAALRVTPFGGRLCMSTVREMTGRELSTWNVCPWLTLTLAGTTQSLEYTSIPINKCITQVSSFNFYVSSTKLI